MARINLLPWREAERKRRQRDFGIMMAVGLVMAVAVSAGMHMHVQGKIDYQNQRNKYLQKEIAALDRKIKTIRNLEKTKENLIARMNVIQRLQESRPEIVRLFDELVSTLPEGVRLTSITQKGRGLNLNGQAQSNARVSAYMRNIDSSEWIGRANLQVIEQKAKKSSALSSFKLSARQINKKKAREKAEKKKDKNKNKKKR